MSSHTGCFETGLSSSRGAGIGAGAGTDTGNEAGTVVGAGAAREAMEAGTPGRVEVCWGGATGEAVGIEGVSAGRESITGWDGDVVGTGGRGDDRRAMLAAGVD